MSVNYVHRVPVPHPDYKTLTKLHHSCQVKKKKLITRTRPLVKLFEEKKEDYNRRVKRKAELTTKIAVIRKNNEEWRNKKNKEHDRLRNVIKNKSQDYLKLLDRYLKISDEYKSLLANNEENLAHIEIGHMHMSRDLLRKFLDKYHSNEMGEHLRIKNLDYKKHNFEKEDLQFLEKTYGYLNDKLHRSLHNEVKMAKAILAEKKQGNIDTYAKVFKIVFNKDLESVTRQQQQQQQQ